MAVTNALAYFDTELITAVKSFTVQIIVLCLRGPVVSCVGVKWRHDTWHKDTQYNGTSGSAISNGR